MESNIDITCNAQWLHNASDAGISLDFGIVTALADVKAICDGYIAECSIVLMTNGYSGYVNDGDFYEKSIEPVDLATSGQMLFTSREEAEQECRKWFNEHIVLAMVKALSFILEPKNFKLVLNASDFEKLPTE